MSVTTEITLPNQPSVGVVQTQPLGGNGIVSPHSTTHFKVSLDGDASGGYLRINVKVDPRFVQLLPSVHVELEGASADAVVDLSIIEGVGSRVAARATAPYLAVNGLSATNYLSWSPWPILLNSNQAYWPQLRLQMGNPGVGVSAVLWGHAYNFDKRAEELTPIEMLTSVVVRAETVI